MRFLITALALFALLAPVASAKSGGHAAKLAQRDSLIHGVAGDEDYVFVTEPGIGVATDGPRVGALDRGSRREKGGLAAPAPGIAVATDGPRVVALDRDSGREKGVLPAPPGGFKLPFTLRVPETG